MSNDFLADRALLVTGGTGSFGRRFIETVRARHRPRKLIVSHDANGHAASL